MSIQLSSNLDYRGKQTLEYRTQYSTLSDMKNMDPEDLNEGLICFNLENNKYYQFHSDNDDDITTGQWKLIEGLNREELETFISDTVGRSLGSSVSMKIINKNTLALYRRNNNTQRDETFASVKLPEASGGWSPSPMDRRHRYINVTTAVDYDSNRIGVQELETISNSNTGSDHDNLTYITEQVNGQLDFVIPVRNENSFRRPNEADQPNQLWAEFSIPFYRDATPDSLGLVKLGFNNEGRKIKVDVDHEHRAYVEIPESLISSSSTSSTSGRGNFVQTTQANYNQLKSSNQIQPETVYFIIG